MASGRFRVVMLALSAMSARGWQVPASAPAFEVASIKPAGPNATGSSTYSPPGRFAMENVSLKDCIKQAFDVKDFSLSGPAWLASPRFDIVAKPPAGTSREQYNAMLQTLLVQRFKLAFHRESKTLPAYALAVDKRGLKVKPVEDDGRPGETWGRGLVRGRRVTMAGFADLLSRHLDRPVKDMTGLSGVYDIKLLYTPDDATAADPPASDSSAASSIFAALQEQAGLKLEAQRLPIEILVVDRIERQPTEN